MNYVRSAEADLTFY